MASSSSEACSLLSEQEAIHDQEQRIGGPDAGRSRVGQAAGSEKHIREALPTLWKGNDSFI